jgi:hypothetical protein
MRSPRTSRDTALAERIERAEADLIARSSRAARERSAGTDGFVIPLAGGVASFAAADSPFNKVAGVGFGGVPGADELDRVERAFAACGAAVPVELATLADPAIGALLTARGYRLESFENVLGRALGGEPGRLTPPGIAVRPSRAPPPRDSGRAALRPARRRRRGRLRGGGRRHSAGI